MTGRLSRCVVACDGEQDEEGSHLGVGEAIAVDLAVDEGTDQIVAGVRAAVRGERTRHLVQVHLGADQHLEGVAPGQVHRVTPGDQRVGGLCHLSALGFGDADHVRERADREFPRAVLDEVGTRSRGAQFADDCPRVVPDRVLDAPHLTRGERGVCDLAQHGVPRRIHGEEGLRGLEQFLRHVLEQHALAGQERLAVAADGDDVGVPRDGPIATVGGIVHQRVLDRRMPAHRAVRA